MNKKILGIIAGTLVILSGLVLINMNQPESGPIKIGALYALSGPSAIFGEISAQGVRDAVRYFEETSGQKVDLVLEDSANDPKIAVSAMTKMLEIDKVRFAVTGLSGVTNAVAPLAEKYNSVLITDAAGYGLTKDKKYLFQGLVPSLNDVSRQINSNAKWQRLAIIYINDEFGNIWQREWQSKIDSGRTVSAFVFEKAQTDFKTTALKIKNFKPDVIAVVGYGPALNQVFADLALQAVSADYLTYLTCTFPGVLTDKRFDLNGQYSYEYPAYADSVIREWLTKNGSPNSTFYGLAFENTLTALNAVRASNNDPEKALNYLKTVKTAGVYGDILFNQNNVVERDLVLTKIENGKCVAGR